MKTSKLLLYTVVFAMIACNDPMIEKTTVTPSDLNALIGKLEFEGSTLVAGKAPEPTTTEETPVIEKALTRSSLTPDNYLFIPISISSTSGYAGFYLALSNEKENVADQYYTVAAPRAGGSQQEMLKIKVPEKIVAGMFILNIQVYTQGGDVSEAHRLQVEIRNPLKGCDGANLTHRSGENQTSVMTYSYDESYFFKDPLGNIITQTLEFSSDKYEDPDRIDVYVDKQWVAGTGTILAYGNAPQPVDCSDNSAGDNGFYSKKSYVQFTIKPNQRIDVYVTSCLGISPWDYWFECPIGPQ